MVTRACSQSGGALAERHHREGEEQQPGDEDVEGLGRREHEQQAADQPEGEGHRREQPDRQARHRPELVPIGPGARPRPRQQGDVRGGVGDIGGQAERDQRGQGRERAAARERIHRAAEHAGPGGEEDLRDD